MSNSFCTFQFAIFSSQLLLKVHVAGYNLCGQDDWVALGIIFSNFTLANLSAWFWWFCILKKMDEGQLRIFFRICFAVWFMIIASEIIILLYRLDPEVTRKETYVCLNYDTFEFLVWFKDVIVDDEATHEKRCFPVWFQCFGRNFEPLTYDPILHFCTVVG